MQRRAMELPTAASRALTPWNARRIEQVVPRRVLPVIVLDSVEHGELVPRSHVDLEPPDAVHDVVVDALGEAAVGFSTRLPIAFQDGGRIVGKRRELWRGRTSNQREATRFGQRSDASGITLKIRVSGENGSPASSGVIEPQLNETPLQRRFPSGIPSSLSC